MGSFVHLHTHSEYSKFDGLARVKAIVSAAKADGQPAVAISDHGTLGALWALRTACDATSPRGQLPAVKPIPAIEAYMTVSGSRHDPERIEVAAESVDLDAGEDGKSSAGSARETKSKLYDHLTIIARTARGLVNLITMSNLSQETKMSGYPLMDYGLLKEYGEGLIVLSGCLGGPVAGPLSRISGNDAERDSQEMDRARANVEKLIDCVGRENVYIEVADHGIEAQDRALPRLFDIAEEYGLKAAAANDAHYIAEDDHDAHEAWLALGLGKVESDPTRYTFSGHGQFFRTGDEMRALRPDDPRWQAACDETVAIAERVEHDIFPAEHLRVPRFPLPKWFLDDRAAGKHPLTPTDAAAAAEYGLDPNTVAYLMWLVTDGERTYRRPDGLSREVAERLRFEFNVICRLKVPDYFLLVHDLIGWARSDYTAEDWVLLHDTGVEKPDRVRKEPILVGPGRGSAGGSEVSYALQIVNIDPIANGLLFERFLDIERTEMPDIDVDFESARRDEVVDYLSVRYGHEKVCRLGAHGTMKAKKSLDSSGRYLSVAKTAVDKIKKTIPDDLASITAAIQKNPPARTGDKDRDESARKNWDDGAEMRSTFLEGGELATMIELAGRIQSTVTSPGRHPCGIVVSDEPLVPLVPMRLDKGQWVTEWDGGDIAAFGLLKMDVLGVLVLDVVKAAAQNVMLNHGDTGFDFQHLDVSGDLAEKTWELLGSGDSSGLFQLESSGMRELLSLSEPHSLDDLSALIAAYRPGPMSANMHLDWARRTGGHEKVSYANLTRSPAEEKVIDSVLGESQGVILFQEQMMRLGKLVGNFDAAQSNNLRRAISKKKQSMIDELRPAFIAGAGVEGIGEDGVTVIPTFSRATAENLWTAFEGSGQYAFNKSHTTAYGVVAYQTSYLKANWPAEFGAAVLRFSGRKADPSRIRIEMMNSLNDRGIEIKAPDINVSEFSTIARDGKVWIGLSEVAGVGKIAEAIISERDRNGLFTSMADVARRVKSVSTTEKDGETKTRSTSVTAGQFASLARAGAFDAFGPRLGHTIASRAVKVLEDYVPDLEYSVVERSAQQRDVIKTNVGEHPMTALTPALLEYYAYDPELEASRTRPRPLSNLPSAPNSPIHTIGIIASIGERLTRKGSHMVTLSLENAREQISGVGFSRLYEALQRAGMPKPGDLVEVRGKVEVREYEREETDEETGETSTRTVVERSMMLDSVIPVKVHDPSRESVAPTLGIGALLTPDEDDDHRPPRPDPEPEPTPVPTLDLGPDPEPEPVPEPVPEPEDVPDERPFSFDSADPAPAPRIDQEAMRHPDVSGREPDPPRPAAAEPAGEPSLSFAEVLDSDAWHQVQAEISRHSEGLPVMLSRVASGRSDPARLSLIEVFSTDGQHSGDTSVVAPNADRDATRVPVAYPLVIKASVPLRLRSMMDDARHGIFVVVGPDPSRDVALVARALKSASWNPVSDLGRVPR